MIRYFLMVFVLLGSLAAQDFPSALEVITSAPDIQDQGVTISQYIITSAPTETSCILPDLGGWNLTGIHIDFNHCTITGISTEPPDLPAIQVEDLSYQGTGWIELHIPLTAREALDWHIVTTESTIAFQNERIIEEGIIASHGLQEVKGCMDERIGIRSSEDFIYDSVPDNPRWRGFPDLPDNCDWKALAIKRRKATSYADGSPKIPYKPPMKYVCEDQTRELMFSKDGRAHCIKFPPDQNSY